ncbi:MAG: polysaccharide pyruvyl transferase family protein [Fibrobacter sp.]|nr:polysaccharide pyruvyl transferase family protein [Fibrobacter sp.]
MKKVGLISYHFWYNYGTVLQSYALWKAISNLGYDSEYIDFKWHWNNQKNQKRSLKLKFKRFLTDPFKHIQKRELQLLNLAMNEFDLFAKKYIPTSNNSFTANDLINFPPEYSRYIVGSDQTWNPLYLKEIDLSIFLLSFVKENTKKFSYAPSIGTLQIDESTMCVYKRELVKFNKISCREKDCCEFLSKNISKDVVHVLDPTFLLNEKQWEEIEVPFKMDGPYILCYILGSKNCISDYAELLGKEKRLPVYYIATSRQYLKKKNKLIGVGPSHFVNLIKNAEFVVTDSFHGTALSINFKKKFYSFSKREGNIHSSDNRRIFGLLEEFSLENRFKNDDDTRFEDDIDYSPVCYKLNDRLDSSYRYLKSIIE